MSTFSIIIPTMSRPTLRRTLISLMHAGVAKTDQVIVIEDGTMGCAESVTKELCATLGVEAVFLRQPTRAGSGAARTRAFTFATRTHLIFIDDDDQFTPNALIAMRQAVSTKPDVPHVFKMRNCNYSRAHWRVLWTDPVLRVGNVGTPMVCLPNIRTKLEVWKDGHPCDDFFFFERTFKNFEAAQWHEDVVADVY